MNETAILPPFVRHRPEKYAVVLNPSSGNGRARRQWKSIAEDVRATIGAFTLYSTEGPGHGTEMTRQALHEGHDRIISAGGDGTHFEVLNGFFDGPSPTHPQASLAILPIGTASDLRRTLDIGRGRAAVHILSSERVLPMDVGRLTSTMEEGETRTTYFNTSVHVGLGGLVCEHANRRSKALGGFLTFLSAVITARFAYSLQEMDIELDGVTMSERCLEVIVANGCFDGGGMRVAPHALLDDGLFEVYVIGPLDVFGTLLNVPRIYRGTQDKHPAVHYARARQVRVTSKSRVLVSPDGEAGGVLPATIEIVPSALRIVTGPHPPVATPAHGAG